MIIIIINKYGIEIITVKKTTNNDHTVKRYCDRNEWFERIQYYYIVVEYNILLLSILVLYGLSINRMRYEVG